MDGDDFTIIKIKIYLTWQLPIMISAIMEKAKYSPSPKNIANRVFFHTRFHLIGFGFQMLFLQQSFWKPWDPFHGCDPKKPQGLDGTQHPGYFIQSWQSSEGGSDAFSRSSEVDSKSIQERCYLGEALLRLDQNDEARMHFLKIVQAGFRLPKHSEDFLKLTNP